MNAESLPRGREAAATMRWNRAKGLVAALFALLLLPQAALAGEKPAAEPTSVEDIVKRVDQQMTFSTRSTKALLRIIDPEETREKELKMFSRGQQDAFLVFLKPDRDKGSRMLKLEGQLWTYFPRTEKTVKISGHLLRQPLMGSDFSYEDMTENRALTERYEGKLLPEEVVDGEPCYVIHFKQKQQGLSYPEMKQWVSKKYLLPLREERYAKTGKLLKVMRFGKITKVGEGRFYPLLIISEDKLKKGSRTELVLSDMVFGVEVPQSIFDLRNLERETAF